MNGWFYDFPYWWNPFRHMGCFVVDDFGSLVHVGWRNQEAFEREFH